VVLYGIEKLSSSLAGSRFLIPKSIHPWLAGAIANQLRSSLVSYSKNEKRAVGKKIESNRPDSRFSAICGYDLAAVLVQLLCPECFDI
jgi:hypothetical protein